MKKPCKYRAVSAVLVSLAAAVLIVAQPPRAAETIIIDGKVFTLDAQHPWAQAVAMMGDKIVAVGEDAQIEKLREPGTKVIDAAGRLVLPGFVDCHIHFLDGSLSLGRVNLEGAKDASDIQQRLRDYAAKHPGKDWVLGRGLNYVMFGPEALPHKKYLDEVFPDQPVLLEGYDGHTYWANSKALSAAGITNETPDPPNGAIVRDPKTHEATGALKESAQGLVARVVPKPSRSENLAALRAGIKWSNEHGLTRVHSAGGDFEYLDLYDELRRQGQQTLRFYIAYFLNPPELRPQDIDVIEAARKKFHDEWIDTNVVKMMGGGVVESNTA